MAQSGSGANLAVLSVYWPPSTRRISLVSGLPCPLRIRFGGHAA
jgi:hypothetical protein